MVFPILVISYTATKVMRENLTFVFWFNFINIVDACLEFRLSLFQLGKGIRQMIQFLGDDMRFEAKIAIPIPLN